MVLNCPSSEVLAVVSEKCKSPVLPIVGVLGVVVVFPWELPSYGGRGFIARQFGEHRGRIPRVLLPLAFASPSGGAL